MSTTTTNADPLLAGMNAEQVQAVRHGAGPLLILAGAGSGKTRVICHRLARLIRDGLAKPHQVLAVTFTNKAAGEMQARTAELLGKTAPRIQVSTFHAFCARLLRTDGAAIGLPRNFVILDRTDQTAVVKAAMKAVGVDPRTVPPGTMIGRISAAKNAVNSAAGIAHIRHRFNDRRVAAVYDEYQRRLRASKGVDFDDLLLYAVKLFSESDKTRTAYATRFRYVMVDEYQDTNRPQYLLIRHLTDAHRNLCVVGDPDQSIYGWRGAELRNILDFKDDYPDAAVVRLERNYRSTAAILEGASRLILHNRMRPEKRLYTSRAGGAPIVVRTAEDERAEADFVVGELQREAAAGRAAVLYRTNAQSRTLEEALLRAGTAYQIVGGIRFYERKEIKDAVAYLKVLVNPDDDVSLRRIINTPTRGISRATIEALENDGEPLWNGIVAATRGNAAAEYGLFAQRSTEPALTGRQREAVARFRTLIEGLVDVAIGNPAAATISAVLERTGYRHRLERENTEEAEERLENLDELVGAAEDYGRRGGDSGLSGFLDEQALLADIDQAAGPDNARVWLMTLHAAKGLEFPLVIMTGMEEGLFPHSRSLDDPEAVEEERRLCYVGMTRAQQRLVLTRAVRRWRFGNTDHCKPSRFLDELASPDEQQQQSGTADAAPSRTHDEVYGIRIGARVRHPTHGTGTVTDTSRQKNGSTVTAVFEHGKHIALKPRKP